MTLSAEISSSLMHRLVRMILEGYRMNRLRNIYGSMDKTMRWAMAAVGVELSLYIVVDVAEKIGQLILSLM